MSAFESSGIFEMVLKTLSNCPEYLTDFFIRESARTESFLLKGKLIAAEVDPKRVL